MTSVKYIVAMWRCMYIGVGAGPAGLVLAGPLSFGDLSFAHALLARLLQLYHFQVLPTPLMYFTEVACIKNKAAVIAISSFTDLSRSAEVLPCKSIQIRTDCSIWPSMLTENIIKLSYPGLLIMHCSMPKKHWNKKDWGQQKLTRYKKWLHTAQQHWVLACKHHISYGRIRMELLHFCKAKYRKFPINAWTLVITGHHAVRSYIPR